MRILRSRDVGGTPVLPEAVTPAKVEDKTPSANPETAIPRGRGSAQVLSPASGSSAGILSLRRSARIGNKVKDTTETPDICIDIGPSIMVTNNYKAEAGVNCNLEDQGPSSHVVESTYSVIKYGEQNVMENYLEGQGPCINNDNAVSSSRNRGNGIRGWRKSKGKRKLSDTAFDSQEPHHEMNSGVKKSPQDAFNNNLEIKIQSEDYRDASIAEHHPGSEILNVGEPVDPVSEDVQQGVMEENAGVENQNQNQNIVLDQNVVQEDVGLENQNQNHNNRVLGQNVMEEDAASGNQNQNQNRVTIRERFLAIARRRASHFAFFKSEDDESSVSRQRPQQNVEGRNDEERGDWPGPFSTARRLVEERSQALAARQEKLAGSGISASLIEWVPTREKDFAPQTVRPSLYDLCMRVLSNHVEFIESLEGIPDAARNKICRAFCSLRKVTPQILRLFIMGSPAEICVPDCSLIPEEDLTELMAQCSTTNLEVLQLGMCGRGLSDHLLQTTLTCPPVGLPCLTRLSLNGAYRLSDIGLGALVRAAPLLNSVDLSQCSLLSEAGINTLADSLAHVIKELRLEECQQLEAIKILPALKRMENLKVLSVAGIPSVTDEFVTELLAYLGCDLKELSLADCRKLTDGALKSIGAVCCGLNVLILDNLDRLTDTALVHLTDGCRSLKTLSLRRCLFSDEAVAAFIGASGNNLLNLSLNGVKEVENHTVLALVSNANENLSRLDVSWCRKLTDEALGLVADSCPLLKELILFGCTQVTDKFLTGHSNSLLKIIGV